MKKSPAKQKTEVKNWYKDRYQYILVQRRILAAITFASLACTFGAIMLILSLIPQKTIEPYVIQVDQKSGITEVVDPVSSRELTGNEAVNNYFIVQYLRAREGYAAANIFDQYNLVRVMSEPNTVFAKFREEADANNRDSNVTRLGSVGKREVKIKSISYLEPQVVQIRVVFIEKDNGISISSQSHKIILLKFGYAKMGLSREERFLNPLGFRVLDYNVYDEVA